MALFEWKDQLSVKVDSIDNQHKKLIDMLNSFYEHINMKSSNQLITDLLSQMKEYTQEHFTKEEELFDRYNYPAAFEHKLEHKEFIQKIEEIESKLIKGQMVVTFEITSYLKEWLRDHIQDTDKQYSEFMVQNGVT